MHKPSSALSSGGESERPLLRHQSSSILEGMKFLNHSKSIGGISAQAEASKSSVTSIILSLRRDYSQGNKKSILKSLESLAYCDLLLFHRVFLSLEIDDDVVYCGDSLSTRSPELLVAYADLQAIIQNILDTCINDIKSYHQVAKSANKPVSGTYFMDLQVLRPS